MEVGKCGEGVDGTSERGDEWEQLCAAAFWRGAVLGCYVGRTWRLGGKLGPPRSQLFLSEK
jgi:hypothetical protein